jgi:nicotinamide/nicotinate riboside kinase
VSFLSSALAYVRRHGTLPPILRSKEDQNEATDPGVEASKIKRLNKEVGAQLTKIQGQYGVGGSGEGPSLTVVFLEGFLLYAPPESEVPQHILRPIHENIHLHLFLPVPYDIVKSRREARSGYVTIGPAPTPTENPHYKEPMQKEESAVDLEKEEDSAAQNFWTDPPGYVDDIVWPRYVQDHAWLLLPEDDEKGTSAQSLAAVFASNGNKTDEELLKLTGQGINVRTDAGVTVAPGKGKIPMTEILDWAVDEVLRCLK